MGRPLSCVVFKMVTGCEYLAGNLAVVETQALRTDDLIIFMTFAGDEHDVATLRL